ncbi:MAG: hypothetical protein GC185_01810 [Alphaproteobacteria bacterium]|nr:hypothetical protein [Alphaproteobacteria bacterium]
MPTEIKPFKTRKEIAREEIRSDMESILTGILERVQRGEIAGIAIATVSADGTPGYNWRGWSRAALSHSLSCLYHRYFTAHTKD